METGAQAECYAKYYIGLHIETGAAGVKFSAPIKVTLGGTEQTLNSLEGQTYATMGSIRTALAADQKALADAGNKDAAAARQKDVDATAAQRTTQQTGETLRGLLLTSYGFSIFGDKANTVASIAFVLAFVLAVLSIAGFVHAWMAKDHLVFEHKDQPAAPGKPVTAN